MAKEYHSRFYHRCFEGFAEKELPDDSGRIKIHRIYTGEYYCPDISDAERIKHKTANASLYLGSVMFYTLAAIQRVPANSEWYMGLLQTGVLIGCLWLSWPLYYYLVSKKKMTVRDYKDSSLWLKHVSLGTAVLLIASAVFSLPATLTSESPQLLKSLCVSGGYALSGLFLLTIFIYERRVRYLTVANDAVRPEKSVMIRY